MDLEQFTAACLTGGSRFQGCVAIQSYVRAKVRVEVISAADSPVALRPLRVTLYFPPAYLFVCVFSFPGIFDRAAAAHACMRTMCTLRAIGRASPWSDSSIWPTQQRTRTGCISRIATARVWHRLRRCSAPLRSICWCTCAWCVWQFVVVCCSNRFVRPDLLLLA